MALDRTWFNALVDDDGTNTVGTVWNKAQIDALLDSVDAFVSAGGTWTAYGPTWTSPDGTPPALGNGNLHGRYFKIGTAVTVWIALKLESTSTPGTGSYFRWNLPFPPKLLPGLPTTATIFSGFAQAPGGSTYGPLVGFWQTGQAIILQTHAGALIGPTQPFAWGPGASISITGTYEVA